MQKSEVKKVAKLAAIEIEAEEIDSLTEDMSNILALVNQMQTVDTKEIKPMSHPQDSTQRLREDLVMSANIREEVQKIAPLTENNLYLVPKVIE